MEENLMLRCIRQSQEYAILILDSFQYEPIYTFPRNFTSVFKPPHKVQDFEIINYRDIKCGLQTITPNYILAVIVPSIPDHIIGNLIQEIIASTKPIFTEMAITQEDFTSSRTDRSVRQKKILKPDIYEKLSEILESFLSLCIYKIFPYFLYEDEEFENSSINFQCVSLPIGIGGVGLYLPLPVDLAFAVEMICHVLYHESTVTIHEILTLESPAGVLKEIALVYKGFVISGSLPHEFLTEAFRIYNTKRMYLRNDASPQETNVEKIKKNGEDLIFSFVGVRGLVIVMVLSVINENNQVYDAWMTDKAKRMLTEMQETKTIDKIEDEFKKLHYKIEKDVFEDPKKLEILNNMKKSRSLDSSPIGSPREKGYKDKIYQPIYYPQHQLHVFHYAIVDSNTLLINAPIVIASSNWFLYVMRPLFLHYANLYEKIKNSAKEFLVVNAKFSEFLNSEKIAVVKHKNFTIYAMFRGNIQNVKQFAYEIIGKNLNF